MPENPLRIVIADDDEPVRNMLKNFFDLLFKEVAVVGLAASGEELLEVVKTTVPDAVFVDVQMPGLDGLSAVHMMQREFPHLFVVFISAHTHYAVEAFNLDATDFLAKPVTVDRLRKSLDKIMYFKSLTAAVGRPGDQQPADWPGRLVLKSGHGITILDKNSIVFVEKQGTKSVFHTSTGNYEAVCSLSYLEKFLREPAFLRCHKSFIINVSKVLRIEPYADRAYQVFFSDYPLTVTMRREKFHEFCRLINYLS